MARSCSTCKSNNNKTWLGNSSVAGTLLVILIPKCPICIMAYTSAITVCGGSDFYFADNNWVSFIPLLMAFLVSGLIILNWRGTVTYAAVALAATGTLLLVLTHQLIIPSGWYNAGSVLLILAIWMNGSFSSFVTTVRNLVSKLFRIWQR